MDHYHGCIEARCARGTDFSTSETYFHYQQHLKSLHSYWSYQGHFSKSTVGPSSFIVFAIGVEQLHSAVIAPFPSVNLCPFLLLPWARCRYPTPTQNDHTDTLQERNFTACRKKTLLLLWRRPLIHKSVLLVLYGALILLRFLTSTFLSWCLLK